MNSGRHYTIHGRKYTGEELKTICLDGIADKQTKPWEKKAYRFILDFLDPGEFIFQQTSGTTGKPKKIRLLKSAMLKSANMTLSFLKLKENTSALLCLPVDYIAGKMMIVRALAGNLNLLIREPTGRPLRDFSEQVDFAAMVPMQVFETLQHEDSLGNIGNLIIGGGEISPDLRERLMGIQGPKIFESFAMTETCSHFALKPLNGPGTRDDFRVLREFRIDQDDRGCLVVYAPGITESPVHTNDLVIITATNKFRWLGRIDNIINSGGLKFIAEEIEKKIRRHLELTCVIVPVKDARLGQKPVLVIQGDENEMDGELILGKLKKFLDPAEVPRTILTMKEIPRNRALKPDRILITRKVEKMLR